MTYKEFIQNILDTRGRFSCGNEYHERHHIIPKCLGGTNDEENLIDLFAREHFIAHRLLALENPTDKRLTFAWWNMAQCKGSSKKREAVTPEEYEEAKVVRSSMISELLKGRTFTNETLNKMRESQKARYKNGGKSTFYGKHHTDESKQKLRESRLGKKETKEHRYKIGLGVKNSEKYRAAMKEVGKKVICEGVVYNSISECARHYGMGDTSLNHYLYDRPMPKKWKDRGLMYYKDYLEEGGLDDCKKT